MGCSCRREGEAKRGEGMTMQITKVSCRGRESPKKQRG
ncbi:hypothetical protein OIU78_026945 [Salix suchowensis]|nr:hypothetical protein OIU78_026945 [Salix suchowensis]